MIGYINGKVSESFGDSVLLENNGIGYEILCSTTAYSRLVKDGNGGIYTYMSVKEDGITLYGFDSMSEKKMFLKLIGVSGVGPKMAMCFLSSMSLEELSIAIATSDVKTLSATKGCGKKTAERVIVELRESISSLDLDSVPKSVAAKETPEEQDAIIALMGLGYNRSMSTGAVKKATESGCKTIEQILAYSIKNI